MGLVEGQMVETNKEKKWLYRGTDTRKFSYMKDWSNKSQFHAVPWNVSNDHHTSHSLRERKYMDANKLKNCLRNTANWS